MAGWGDDMKLATAALAAAVFSCGAAHAATADLRFSGKLLLTGGVSSVEGAGGGGIATWATITSYGAADGYGANLHATYVGLPDYSLKSVGAAVGLGDRLELSYARQVFDTGDTGAKLGLGQGFKFTQDVIGAKVRLVGDSVYDQPWLPEISIGAQLKHNDQGAVIHAVGGRQEDGADFYAAATKAVLSQSLVVSGAVRLTKANQMGLLGFGGDRSDAYHPEFEGSLGYLLSKRFVVGAEYRSKPDNLSFARENDWYDLFAAYAFSKHLSATVAYADLGSIATFAGQRGVYLSLQAGF
jgi:hypothetical protein